MSVTIGADPEVFLYETSPVFDGYLPAEDIVDGTKDDPFGFGDGTFVHVDNVCVEFGWDPVQDAAVFADLATTAKHNALREFLDPDTQNWWYADSATFNADQLQSENNQRFGCDPDYDAYTGGKVRSAVPRAIKNGAIRFAGGHIHIGGDFNCPPFVAALFGDIFLNLKGITQTWQGYMNSGRAHRMEWYGRPGLYRQKPYGIEYRSLSNEWFASAKSTRRAGEAALRLGTYLENTSARTLREKLQTLPWGQIREVLSVSQVSNEVRVRAGELLDTCRSEGVPA